METVSSALLGNFSYKYCLFFIHMMCCWVCDSSSSGFQWNSNALLLRTAQSGANNHIQVCPYLRVLWYIYALCPILDLVLEQKTLRDNTRRRWLTCIATKFIECNKKNVKFPSVQMFPNVFGDHRVKVGWHLQLWPCDDSYHQRGLCVRVFVCQPDVRSGIYTGISGRALWDTGSIVDDVFMAARVPVLVLFPSLLTLVVEVLDMKISTTNGGKM